MPEKLMDIKELEDVMKEKGILRFDESCETTDIMMLDIPKRIIDKENGLVLYVALVRPVVDIKTGVMGAIMYVILDEETVMGMKKQIEDEEKSKECDIGYV